MAWRRPGDQPLFEPLMVSLLTHICITLPQWFKKCDSFMTWQSFLHFLWENPSVTSILPSQRNSKTQLWKFLCLWSEPCHIEARYNETSPETSPSKQCFLLRRHLDIETGRWQHPISWWRHQMETYSALLAICAGNSPVPGEFPAQRPVTRNFDVFFDLRPNKLLSKQWRGWWFETPSRPLWRHRNV